MFPLRINSFHVDRLFHVYKRPNFKGDITSYAKGEKRSCGEKQLSSQIFYNVNRAYLLCISEITFFSKVFLWHLRDSLPGSISPYVNVFLRNKNEYDTIRLRTIIWHNLSKAGYSIYYKEIYAASSSLHVLISWVYDHDYKLSVHMQRLTT